MKLYHITTKDFGDPEDFLIDHFLVAESEKTALIKLEDHLPYGEIEAKGNGGFLYLKGPI